MRKINLSTDSESIVAGNGIAGYSGDTGIATAAELNDPEGLGVDSSGNIYIADQGNNVVRKLSTSGIITTFAEDHIRGYSGDGGSATSAELNGPTAVAVDSSGNVYIGDGHNFRVRMVSVSTGVISTVAGDGVYGYTGDGAAATSAEIGVPSAILVDASSDIYIADPDNCVVREVSSSSSYISTFAGNGTCGYSGDGGPATAAELQNPDALSEDATGNIYISDSGCDVIREVSTSSGDIGTVAGDGTSGYSGDGGSATSAQLSEPAGLAFDSSGDLFVADYGNYV